MEEREKKTRAICKNCEGTDIYFEDSMVGADFNDKLEDD